MILEFSITNYRSIREKQLFTMYASGAKSKSNNTFEVSLNNGGNLKLTKSAGIYGANASGKSNIIRALFEFRRFIVDSKEMEIDKSIPAYDPFLFDTKSYNKAVEFEIIFISKEKSKYQYKIAFNQNEIVEESLYHFPNKKSQEVFVRGKEKNPHDENIHTIKLGKNFGYKKYEIYKKIPLLSIFGKAENYHTNISPAYTFFNEIEIWNVTESSWVRRLADYIKQELQEPDYKALIPQISELINEADTQIQNLIVEQNSHPEDSEENNNPDNSNFRLKRREVLYGEHNVFDKNKVVAKHYLPFFNESFGTNKLFALGGLIIKMINKGGIIIFDELDS